MLHGLDVDDVLVSGVGGTEGLQQQVGETDDRRQHVVEVVGDATGEFANRLHLLALRELQFECPLLGHVDQEDDSDLARS